MTHCAISFSLEWGDSVLKAKPAVRQGNRYECGILLMCLLVPAIHGWGQKPSDAGSAANSANPDILLSRNDIQGSAVPSPRSKACPYAASCSKGLQPIG